MLPRRLGYLIGFINQ